MTKNFKINEFIVSETADRNGIDNVPTDNAVLSALALTMRGMEQIRVELGDRPIRITSGYRCERLNAAVGGVKSSQHLKGEACDFVCPSFGSPKQIVKHLAAKIRELGIDQIIQEGSWVHVSFKESPRGLVMSKVNGKIVKGLV